MDIGEPRKQSCTHGPIIMLMRVTVHQLFSLFMTFSCAEYFWPDLKRLLEELIFAAESRVVDLDEDDSERNRAVNEYSIVVQEFFN